VGSRWGGADGTRTPSELVLRTRTLTEYTACASAKTKKMRLISSQSSKQSQRRERGVYLTNSNTIEHYERLHHARLSEHRGLSRVPCGYRRRAKCSRGAVQQYARNGVGTYIGGRQIKRAHPRGGGAGGREYTHALSRRVTADPAQGSLIIFITSSSELDHIHQHHHQRALLSGT